MGITLGTFRRFCVPHDKIIWTNDRARFRSCDHLRFSNLFVETRYLIDEFMIFFDTRDQPITLYCPYTSLIGPNEFRVFIWAAFAMGGRATKVAALAGNMTAAKLKLSFAIVGFRKAVCWHRWSLYSVTSEKSKF